MVSGLFGTTGRVVALVVLATGSVVQDTAPPASYDWLLGQVTASGGDPVFGAESHEYAMTYGLVLSAAGHAGDEQTAELAADWLQADMLDGGWGMAWTWDPFGDGSPTPAGTPFAITTAIAINGLMDWGMDHANAIEIGRILVAWARTAWTDGYYWYSMLPRDAIDTPNVNAMLAGVTARFLATDTGALTPGDRSLLQDRVARSFDHIAGGQAQSVSWRYSVVHEVVNDLSHHVYILWGAELARDAGFRIGWTRADAIASLDRFDIVYPRDIRLTPDMAARSESPWRVSGAGAALLFTCSWGGDVERWLAEARRSIRAIPTVPRFAAHALPGLAMHAAGAC